jgi:tetratricopeptide (TPR) repeat protein
VLFIGHGQFAEAAAAYEKALSLNPQAGWYQLQLAHACAYLRDFGRGEAAARRAIQLQEGFLSGRDGVQIVGAYLRLGHLYALQGRNDEAIACYEREGTYIREVNHLLRERTTIEILTRTGSAHLAAGREGAAREQLARAVAAFEDWLGLGADDASTRYYAACARALLGDLEGALCDLTNAASVRRAFTVARARLEPDLAGLRSHPGFEALVA